MPACRLLTMLRSLGLFALVAFAITLVWYGTGRPVLMPPSPLASGEKLTCIFYTPFHGDQAPFTSDLHIADQQIASDLKSLAQTTACVLTYSARGAEVRGTTLAAGLCLELLHRIWL